jgi:branched-chain amino acid aminotransferase
VEQSELIWMNGEFVAWEDAKVHVLTHGLHYGTGVFEGIRCYDTEIGPAVFRHADHVDRLFRSAELYYMPLPFSREQLREATLELIGRNNLRSCYIRPIAFRGYGTMGLFPLDAPVDVSIAVWKWGAYLGEESKQRGVRAKVSSWRRISGDALIPHAKASGQYLNSILAKVETHKAGYEEAILLDDRGFVCEGSGENIFVVRDGVISTPAADRLDPRRDQPPVGDPDRPRPRVRARRARHRPRRALPRRRDLPHRHRRRARPGPRGGRPPGRRGHRRGGHPGRPGAFEDALHGRSERYREWLDPVPAFKAQRGRVTPPVELYDATLRDGMQGEG